MLFIYRLRTEPGADYNLLTRLDMETKSCYPDMEVGSD